jgi:AcrR family transcriptional regulator
MTAIAELDPVITRPMRLRINRSGRFSVTPATTDEQHQCGYTRASVFSYFVSIEALNHTLTEEGFVMDNNWVDEFFQEAYSRSDRVAPPCETIAQEAIYYFLNLFESHMALLTVQPTHILVRIHGSEVSYIEAEWPVKQ